VAVVAAGRLVLAPLVTAIPSFALAAVVLAGLYAGVVWIIDGRTLLRAFSVVPGVADGELVAVR
jgi:hypothetical protein